MCHYNFTTHLVCLLLLFRFTFCCINLLTIRLLNLLQIMNITRLRFSISVGAQSTLGEGQDVFARKYRAYAWKVNKMPEFYMIFAREINKIPEFYMIYARKNNKMPEFYMIFARKNIFSRIWGQVPSLPPPPSPTLVWDLVCWFLQGVSIACYASPVLAIRSGCLSVRLSHANTQ